MDEIAMTSDIGRFLPSQPASSPGPLDLSVRLESLWERMGGDLLASVATLEEALAAVPESRLDEELRGRAERDAHRLAGSAGTFGRHDASSLARQLEELFAGPAPIEPGALPEALRQVEALRAELSGSPEPSPTGGDERAALLIVHRDAEWANAVGLAAATSGFDARMAHNLDMARRVLGEVRPAVALVDLALPDATALQLVAELVDQSPPVA
ncbi:MAG: Hpt domain-containing protein, partial [Acidimicrobiales bacterium]|nr:Hpt domain-containing protein [Acidimicrobiales bacterium]